MELITQAQRERLLANGWRNAEHMAKDGNNEDFSPVVKLFCPWGGATWLLTELDPQDLGMGEPELGNVSLSEIAAVRGPGGLTIERDLHFKPEKTLQDYADEARELGRIAA